MRLLNKLEEFKMMGMYQVQCWYGSCDVGCDDHDVPIMEREFILIAYPVGCLGSTKVMYKGTVQGFLDLDLKTTPTQVPNPPSNGEVDGNGYFLWGTEDGIKLIIDRNFGGSDETVID